MKFYVYHDCFDEVLLRHLVFLKNRASRKGFISEAIHNTQYSQNQGRIVHIGIVIDRKQCIGFCTVKVQRVGRKHWGRYATLTYIYIDEKHRREGCGACLATATLLDARADRLKALAASLGGLALFHHLDCTFWGLSPEGKGIIDTPWDTENPSLVDMQPPYARYFGGTDKPIPYRSMVKLFNEWHHQKQHAG